MKRRGLHFHSFTELTLAFIHHENQFTFFPSAGGPDWTYHMTYVDGMPATAPDQHGGWGFQILPFIEAESVWLGGGYEDDLDKSIHAISTPNPLFFCPTRRSPEVVTAKDWYSHPSNSGKTYGHAKNDYAAASLDTATGYSNGIGAVTRMEPTRRSDFHRDGMTHTMLLGEKQINLCNLGKLQANDNEGYTCGWNHDIMRHTNSPPRPDFYVNSTETGNDLFGSSHGRFLNISTVGGSVHTITHDVDAEVFKRLGHRDDGKIVSVP